VGLVIEGRCKKRLTLMSVVELEGRLKDPYCPEMHLLLAEIRARGENLGKYRPHLIEELGNAEGPRRLFAFRAFREGFPLDVERIRDYTPYEPAEKCKKKTERLNDA
jgi:hypothetical protein